MYMSSTCSDNAGLDVDDSDVVEDVSACSHIPTQGCSFGDAEIGVNTSNSSTWGCGKACVCHKRSPAPLA